MVSADFLSQNLASSRLYSFVCVGRCLHSTQLVNIALFTSCYVNIVRYVLATEFLFILSNQSLISCIISHYRIFYQLLDLQRPSPAIRRVPPRCHHSCFQSRSSCIVCHYHQTHKKGKIEINLQL